MELLTGIPANEIPQLQQQQRPKPRVRIKLKGASALTYSKDKERADKILGLVTRSY
jgi:hypothetical protein